MNGYEKLRKKNDELREQYRALLSDFYKVIDNPSSEESISIIMRIKWDTFRAILGKDGFDEISKKLEDEN